MSVSLILPLHRRVHGGVDAIRILVPRVQPLGNFAIPQPPIPLRIHPRRFEGGGELVSKRVKPVHLPRSVADVCLVPQPLDQVVHWPFSWSSAARAALALLLALASRHFTASQYPRHCASASASSRTKSFSSICICMTVLLTKRGRLALNRHALLSHGLEDVRYGVVSVQSGR